MQTAGFWRSKCVIVTGASSGIGRACAVALAEQGIADRVAVGWSANESGGAQTCKEVEAARKSYEKQMAARAGE